MQFDLQKLKEDNTRDRQQCDEWMRTATPADVLAVWCAAQKTYPSATMEVLSRFAALAIGEAMVRKMQNEKQ